MHMEGLRRHVARCMQEKRQSRRRNLYRSADDSDILGQSKDQVYSSLPLPLALSVAHLATTTTICTWRDCEDMSQDGMQEKRQSRRRNLYRSADDSDILGQSKDQVYSSLPLPLALSVAHLATTTTICTWRDCEDMSQDGMQEKRQSRRRNLYRSADDSDILGQSKDKVYSSLPLPLALSVAHLATTTTICTWRDCEDMSQDGMQDKRQK